MYVISVKLTE